MVEYVSSEDVGSAPPIPPRTNEMYLLEHRNSERETTCANYIPATDDQTRDCFIMESHIAERGSDTESMSAWIEDAKTEVDRDIRILFLRQAGILAFPHPSQDELKICSLPKVLTLVTMPQSRFQ